MKATARWERNDAIVVTLSDVRKLWTALEERVGPVELTANCSDEIHRDFSSIEEFSAFDNAPNKRIDGISIESRSKDYQRTVSLELAGFRFRTIQMTIRGDEQFVTRLDHDLRDILDGIRPWYARLSKLDFFYVIGFAAWFAFVTVKYYFDRNPPDAAEPIGLTYATYFSLAGIGVLGLIALTIWSLNWLRERFFPIAYFAIGQGERRYQIDEKIRWGVIIAFLISIAASGVMAIIT